MDDDFKSITLEDLDKLEVDRKGRIRWQGQKLSFLSERVDWSAMVIAATTVAAVILRAIDIVHRWSR